MFLIFIAVPQLSFFPQTAFVINQILPKLVERQVWEVPLLFEGFVRCVQQTQPESFAVIHLLPEDVRQRAVAAFDEVTRAAFEDSLVETAAGGEVEVEQQQQQPEAEAQLPVADDDLDAAPSPISDNMSEASA